MKPWTWRQAIIKSDLPATTRHVLLTIACHINDAGESAFPSIELLVSETGLSRRAVIDHIAAAEQAGWICVTKHGFKGRRWARNEYMPLVPEQPVMDVKPVSDGAEDEAEGGAAGAPPQPRGGARPALEVVHQVHPNRPSIKTNLPHSPQGGDLLGDPESDLCAWFDVEFWSAYPAKVAKPKAWKAIRRLKPDGDLRARIVLGVRAFVARIEQQKRSKGWAPEWPHPASWLNAERWNDETGSLSASPGAPPAVADRCLVCGGPWSFRSGGKAYCRSHNPDLTAP